MLAYYSGFILRDKISALIRNIAYSEFAVMSVMRFLTICSDGVLDNYGLDPRVTNYDGVIVPLQGRLLDLINAVGVMHCVRSTGFDAASSLMAVHRASKCVDWRAVPGDYAHKFLPYDFARAEVAPLTESTNMTLTRGKKVYRPAVPVVPWMRGSEPQAGEWRIQKEKAARYFEAVDGTKPPAAFTDEPSSVDTERREASAALVREAANEVAQALTAGDSPEGMEGVDVGIVQASVEAAQGAVSSELEDLRGRLATAEARVKELETEKGSLETTLRGVRAAKKKVDGELVEAKAAGEKASANLSSETAERVRLEGRNGKLAGTCQSLRSELDQVKGESDARRATLDKYGKLLDGLRDFMTKPDGVDGVSLTTVSARVMERVSHEVAQTMRQSISDVVNRFPTDDASG